MLKFKCRAFRKLIVSIADKPMKEQGAELGTSYESRKGELEQIDDVVLIGLKF